MFTHNPYLYQRVGDLEAGNEVHTQRENGHLNKLACYSEERHGASVVEYRFSANQDRAKQPLQDILNTSATPWLNPCKSDRHLDLHKVAAQLK